MEEQNMDHVSRFFDLLRHKIWAYKYNDRVGFSEIETETRKIFNILGKMPEEIPFIPTLDFAEANFEIGKHSAIVRLPDVDGYGHFAHVRPKRRISKIFIHNLQKRHHL